MEIVLAILTGFLFPTAIIFIKNYVNVKNELRKSKLEIENRDKQEVELLANGLCCVIRITIIDYHKRYMHEGSIPLYALENVKTMYSVYSAFGVNGISDLMEELGNLPIRN